MDDTNQAVSPTQPSLQVKAPIEKDHSATVALLLVWFYPVGVILTWVWMKKWSKLTKILLSFHLVLALIVAIAWLIIFATIFKSNKTLNQTSSRIPSPSASSTAYSGPLPSFPPPSTSSPTAQLAPIKNVNELPIIAGVVTDYLIKNGYQHPEISFIRNDGILASGDVGELGTAGGALWFAYNNKGTWTVINVGNGLPKCSDIAKYNLPEGLMSCY